MRILLVDDAKLSRTSLKGFFAEMEELEIAEASSGIEALEIHRTFKPHIVFLDLIMPSPDGLGVLKTLTKIDKKVKIIIVSVIGNQPSVSQECMKNGAFLVLAKPLVKETALDALSRAQIQIDQGESIK